MILKLIIFAVAGYFIYKFLGRKTSYYRREELEKRKNWMQTRL